MNNNDEIAKLAREYAEDATKADAGDPNLSASDLNGIKHDVAEYAEKVISWLLRTHCIVSKEKVRERHDNELEFAQFYQRNANSCCNQQYKLDYEISRDIAKSRAKMLESLFGAETFKKQSDMKARIKSTGEIIDIITITDPGLGDKKIYKATDRRWYREHELDFSVNETKEAESEVLRCWVARDKDNNLYAYSNIPERVLGISRWMGDVVMFPNNDLFPSLTWDSEPMEVEIIIIPKKK